MSVIRRLNDRGIYLVRPTILTVDKEQFTEDEYPSDDETDTGAIKTFTCSKGARWVRHMPTTLAQTSEQSMAMQAGDYVYLAGPMTSKGRPAEIGQIICFYDDPANSEESIWIKYQEFVRQDKIEPEGEDRELDFELHELLELVGAPEFCRLNCIELDTPEVFTSMDEFTEGPHAYLCRRTWDPASKKIAPRHLPAVEAAGETEATAEEGAQADEATAEEGAQADDVDAAPAAAAVPAAEPGPEQAGAADAPAPAGRAPRRGSAMSEVSALKRVIEQQNSRLTALKTQVEAQQELIQIQGAQLVRALAAAGTAQSLEARMSVLESLSKRVDTIEGQFEILQGEVKGIQDEL